MARGGGLLASSQRLTVASVDGAQLGHFLARDAGVLAQGHEVGLVCLPAVQAVQPPAHRPRRGVRLGALYCA